jgi:hypothetical protein
VHGLNAALGQLCVDHATYVSQGDLERLADRLGWPEEERWFLATGRPLEDALVASRSDVFVSSGQFKILEININSCLNGATASSVLASALMESRLGIEMTRAHRLAPRSYLDELAGWWRRRLGAHASDIALLGFQCDGDEGEERWVDEHRRCFLRHGLSCEFVPVDEADVADGALAYRGKRFTAAIRYFMATPADLLVEPAVAKRHRDFFRALEQASSTIFMGSYAGQLFSSKALLADILQCSGLSAAQQRIVKHIPWLARLEPVHVDKHGERVDPIRWAARNRMSAVIKPSHGHGSQGVVVGAAVSEARWIQAIDVAVRNGGHIVQERVSPEAWTNLYWDIEADGLVEMERPVLLGPFGLDGRDAGCLSRQPVRGDEFELANRRANITLGCVMPA